MSHELFTHFPPKVGELKISGLLSHHRSFERKGRGEADLPAQLGIDLLAFRQHFHKLLYVGRARLGFFRRPDSEDDGIAVHAV